MAGKGVEIKEVKDVFDLYDSKAIGIVDRDREVRQMVYALLTREHMLLKGPPGTAKSLFARNAFSTIDSAKVFEIHLTKQTTEEYVFGPLNIVDLKRGVLTHNIDDSMLTADFAFIDEFFDASDVLLRSLLGVLNERLWLKGSQRVEAKLHTAILTSNYQRENEITEAVLDRILFKCEMNPLTQKSKRIKLYQDYIQHPNFQSKKLLDLETLRKFSEIIDDPTGVAISKDILEIFDDLIEEFVKESSGRDKGKYISHRTVNKSLKVLKAAALLAGRNNVDMQDLEELRYVLCTINNRMEEEIFDAVYKRVVGDLLEGQRMLIVMDEVDAKVKAFPPEFRDYPRKEFVDTMKEIGGIVDMLENLQSNNTAVRKKKEEILMYLRSMVAKNRDGIKGKTT